MVGLDSAGKTTILYKLQVSLGALPVGGFLVVFYRLVGRI